MATPETTAYPAAPESEAERRAHGSNSFHRVLAVVLGWMSVWWLVIGALLAPVLPGGWLPIFAAALLAAAPLLVLGRIFTTGAYHTAAVRLWILRPFWYIQAGLPLVAASGMIGTMLGVPFGAAGTAGRWTVLLATTGYALAAVAGYVGSRRLRVQELEARFPNLPPSLEGLRIVQLSDLHVGPHTPRRFLARVVRAVQSATPDLIAITGDQVDDYARDVVHFADAFAELSAPLGIFAVAGNHDVYAGWGDVRAGLEAMGITVLVNDAVEVGRGDARFWVAGAGDPAGAGWSRHGGADAAPDIARTLSRVPPDAFTLALAHNPALWSDLARRGVDLTLSGHTHHGQVSIPRLGWSLASPFLALAMGSHRQEDSLLYINPGTNYWGLPLRLGALPEVSVLTLRRAHDSEGGIEAVRSHIVPR